MSDLESEGKSSVAAEAVKGGEKEEAKRGKAGRSLWARLRGKKKDGEAPVDSESSSPTIKAGVAGNKAPGASGFLAYIVDLS